MSLPILVSANTIFDLEGPIGDTIREARDNRSSSKPSFLDMLFGAKQLDRFYLDSRESCVNHMSSLMSAHAYSKEIMIFAYYDRPLYEYNLMDKSEESLKSWMDPDDLSLPRNAKRQFTTVVYENAIHSHRACAKDIKVGESKKVKLSLDSVVKTCRQTQMSYDENIFYSYFCLKDRAAYISFGEKQ